MSHQYIFFLGSHPELSRVEVESVLRARGLAFEIQEESLEYLLVSVPAPLDAQLQDVLGGCDRFGELLGTFPELPTATQLGILLVPKKMGTKKMSVGVSGMGVDRDYLIRVGGGLKDWWVAEGGKMRFVLPNGRAERLNAASVMAHRLDEAPNSELTVVRLHSGSFGVFRTVAVQDIRSYEQRDTKRPVRDAHVGLLPPKLAQIMLNIAVGLVTPPPLRSVDGQSYAGQNPFRILDPFCGMGTILQEGWLADYKMTGTDSSERMIRASEKNLKWLAQHFKLTEPLTPRVFVHQADTRWSQRWYGAFDAVVTEPFLGKPIKSTLPIKELTKRMDALGEVYRGFFRATWATLRPNGVIVFALPAWRTEWRGEDWDLFPEAFLDGIARLGYSKVQLGKDARGTLLYARPDALVGRELTVWQKKGNL